MSDFVTVATFSSAAEASPVRAQLEAQDIQTYLDGETVADTLWHLGAGLSGVKLMVASTDEERALACLGVVEEEAGPNDSWNCANCGEHVDAGFVACWSCGAAYQAQQNRIGQAETDHSQDSTWRPLTRRTVACPVCQGEIRADANECRHCGEHLAPQELESQKDVEEEPTEIQEEANAILTRAFRGAILGIGFLPPLVTLYSMHTLSKFQQLKREYQLESDWRENTTMIVNWLAILATSTLIFFIFRPG